MTFWEKIYVPEILRGLAITNYHFVRNLMLHTAHLWTGKDVIGPSTTQYPDERKHYSEISR